MGKRRRRGRACRRISSIQYAVAQHTVCRGHCHCHCHCHQCPSGRQVAMPRMLMMKGACHKHTQRMQTGFTCCRECIEQVVLQVCVAEFCGSWAGQHRSDRSTLPQHTTALSAMCKTCNNTAITGTYSQRYRAPEADPRLAPRPPESCQSGKPSKQTSRLPRHAPIYRERNLQHVQSCR